MKKNEVKKQGFDAFKAGKFESANPYKANGWQHETWQEGWVHAHDGKDLGGDGENQTA